MCRLKHVQPCVLRFEKLDGEIFILAPLAAQAQPLQAEATLGDTVGPFGVIEVQETLVEGSAGEEPTRSIVGSNQADEKDTVSKQQPLLRRS